MANIQDLRDALDKVAEKEEDIFDSKASHQFFIELFGAKNLDSLLDNFDPSEHNSKVQEEFQNMKQGSYDMDAMIKNRRAVAYMFSGKMCMKRHYGENELTLHVMGFPRMAWVRNELKQLEMTQQDGQKVWVAEEG